MDISINRKLTTTMSKLQELKTDLVQIRKKIENGQKIGLEININIKNDEREIILIALNAYIKNIFGD